MSQDRPDVLLAGTAAPEKVGHAAGGFARLGSFLGVAHVHAHDCRCCESASDVLLRLGKYDVHLTTIVKKKNPLEQIHIDKNKPRRENFGLVQFVSFLPLGQTCSREPLWHLG